MKRTFLAKLQRRALLCLIGALLLIVGVPLYQLIVLNPAGYSNALNTLAQTVRWINEHGLLFAGYRAFLIAGFALMLGFPFALFRIIVAQEIIGREDLEETDEAGESEEDEDDEDEDGEDDESLAQEASAQPAGENSPEKQSDQENKQANTTDDGMPEFAWRGKGFAVLAAWTGMLGLLFFVAATLASTVYLLVSAASTPSHTGGDVAPLAGLFAILTYTVGGGLLSLSSLFFGVVIARSGRRLWPDSWVFFGYVALALAALMSGSAVAVAFASTTGQSALSTPAILLFALWALWFGVMVVRLKPE